MPVAFQADVLLIAGSAIDTEVMLNVLHGQTTSIRTAVVRSGAEASHFLKVCKSVPSVILLDIQPPDIDGIELLRRIRSDERMSDVPVLILSGKMNAAQKHDARCLGANGYIAQTNDPELLADRLSIVKHLSPSEHHHGRRFTEVLTY